MSVNTWAAFAGSDDVAGSTAILRCVRMGYKSCSRPWGAAGINIVAIHQHMTEEQPRYMFLHYWRKDALLTSRERQERRRCTSRYCA
jgi:hypothetical protein